MYLLEVRPVLIIVTDDDSERLHQVDGIGSWIGSTISLPYIIAIILVIILVIIVIKK